MKRIGMMNIKGILQHRHGLGLTRAQTATAVGVSTGTVSHILERASAAGLSWPLPDDLDDEGLRARLYPSVARDAGCVQPDWETVLEELGRKRKRRRTRVTRRAWRRGAGREREEPALGHHGDAVVGGGGVDRARPEGELRRGRRDLHGRRPWPAGDRRGRGAGGRADAGGEREGELRSGLERHVGYGRDRRRRGPVQPGGEPLRTCERQARHRHRA